MLGAQGGCSMPPHAVCAQHCVPNNEIARARSANIGLRMGASPDVSLHASLEGDRQTTTRSVLIYLSLGNCQRTNWVLVVLFGMHRSCVHRAAGGHECGVVRDWILDRCSLCDELARATGLAVGIDLAIWRN